jgi:hypothetical protein
VAKENATITPKVFSGISEEDLITKKGRARWKESSFGLRPQSSKGTIVSSLYGEHDR